MAFLMPQVGLYLWGWLDYMQPHREVYGFASDLQLNLIVACATIIGLFVSKERKFPDFSWPTLWLALLTAWVFVSHLFSLEPQQSWQYTDRAWRVYLFIFLILIIAHSRIRMHALLWILGISIAYYSLKGGIFTILTGGQARVWGPPTTMIGDNNHLAIATAAVIPILNYLRLQSRNLYVRFGVCAVLFFSVISIIGSLSRGGFIALMVCAAFFWWRSRHKGLLALAAAVVIIPAAIYFLPQNWTERIQTIEEIDTDSSFQGRIDAWKNNIDVALENPLTGAGLRVPYLDYVMVNYQSESRETRAAHSMYFEILGGTGFVGFFFFAMYMGSGWFTLSKVRKRTYGIREWQWAHDLATMSQVSLAAFFVGAASVSMEFWSGYMTIIAIGTNMLILVRKHLPAAADTPVRAGARSRGRGSWRARPSPS
jgi:probable O-glycosylation ligase (exosortase A-associated)